MASLQRYRVLASYWWMFMPALAIVGVPALLPAGRRMHQQAAYSPVKNSSAEHRLRPSCWPRSSRVPASLGAADGFPTFSSPGPGNRPPRRPGRDRASRRTADAQSSDGAGQPVARSHPRTIADLIHINRRDAADRARLRHGRGRSRRTGGAYAGAPARHPVLRRRSVRCGRCGVLVSGPPGREGGIDERDFAHRRRAAHCGAQGRSTTGQFTLAQPCAASGKTFDGVAMLPQPPARGRRCRKGVWPTTWGLRTPAAADRRPQAVRYREIRARTADRPRAEPGVSTGRRTAPAPSCPFFACDARCSCS